MELFVVSPYLDAGAVAKHLRAQSTRNVVVSSCVLLPSERAQFFANDPNATLHLLREGFTDAALTALDDATTGDIDRLAVEANATNAMNFAYLELFMSSVARRRNRLAAQWIRARYGPATALRVCPGPNIVSAPWAATFPEAIVSELPRATLEITETKRPAATAAPPASPAREIYATSSPAALLRTRQFAPDVGCSILDLSSLAASRRNGFVTRAARFGRLMPSLWQFRGEQKRLQLTAQTDSLDLEISALREVCGPATRRHLRGELESLLLAKKRGARAVLAAMHAFTPIQALAARILGLPMIVLQDGYLPINYPLSVYGVYRGTHFVWWSEASRAWGARFGLGGVVCKPRFSAPTSVSPSLDDVGGSQRVLAMLNHGGEWTSLIFRTDIDQFVDGIVVAARSRPQVMFRIRTHPTMLLDRHDGINAAARLQRLVAESAVPNVSFSSNTLEDDIDWATFAVSEYSLTLLEFALRNRGGIATFNPTGRRNFFEEFTARDVPHATNVPELLALIDRKPTGGGGVIRTLFGTAPGRVADALRELTGRSPQVAST